MEVVENTEHIISGAIRIASGCILLLHALTVSNLIDVHFCSNLISTKVVFINRVLKDMVFQTRFPVFRIVHV